MSTEQARQVTPARRYELGQFTDYIERLPQSLSDYNSHEEQEIQPIWIPDNPDFNIWSRDLTGIPDRGSYDEHSLF